MLALLIVPAAAAAVMLAAAFPAGDAIDGSVAILFGVPASGLASALAFAALFVTLVVVACALDTNNCG